MVIKREIVGRDDANAEISLARPGLAPQICSRSAIWSVFPPVMTVGINRRSAPVIN
jgi:hypothetical protein